MKGKILQRAELYLQKEGEKKARHILTWKVFKAICIELKEETGIDYLKYENRVFLEKRDFPIEGKDIKDWPEEESEYEVGPERLFFCVPPEADFQKIKSVGATLIQTYMWDPRNQGQNFLDKAQQQGLKVLFDIKSQIHDQLREGKPWIRQECEYVVNKFNNHPALYGYYILDEPDAGTDDPAVGVSMELQKEIHTVLRDWTDKPLVIALRGGTRGWHLIDFSLWKIIADSYVFDGTGECWGMEPLEALRLVGTQERTFMDEHVVDFLMFMFQCNFPATGEYETKIPREIENQFNVLNEYGLFLGGVAMYGWDGKGHCPNRTDEIYGEVKELFDKIK